MPTGDNGPSPVPVNGKDGKGKFLPGNRFGKGNPRLAKSMMLKGALLDAVTTGRWATICEQHIKLCEGGDLDAIKLLYAYVLGRPEHQVRLTGDPGDQAYLMGRLQAAVASVLSPYPQARAELAKALAELDREDTEATEE